MSNPFPGLRPFREGEEHLFFGRERQVDAMVDRLAKRRFLAVLGSSGSGKSSLVNCGLRPALHRGLMSTAGSAWRIAQFRPGGRPLDAMAEALAEDGVLFRNYDPAGIPLKGIVEATLRMSDLGLADICQQAQLEPGVNVLVVVDQFEEVFRYGADSAPERQQELVAFMNLLLEARKNPAVPVYIVLTMRSDFLGDCSRFTGLPEAINEGQFLVPRLTRDERRMAIAGPVAVSGCEIDPVLLTRLVNDVGDNPDQLSILQHAVNRTWAYWHHEGGGKGPLTLEHYEAIGGMASALDRHAEKAFGELPTPHAQRICERIFKALTDKGSDARGVRRPAPLESLCAVSECTVEEARAVIDVYRKPSRSFLMPPLSEALQPSTVVDISHESLMRVWKRLAQWDDEEADSANQYRRVSQSAALHAKGAAGLMTDPELSLMLDWRERERPNAAWAERYGGDFERATMFLDASRKVRDAAVFLEERKRRSELWRARLVTAVFCCLGLVASIFAFQAQKAKSIAQIARGKAEKALAKVQKAEAARKAAEAKRDKEEMRADAAAEATQAAETVNLQLKAAIIEAQYQADRARTATAAMASSLPAQLDLRQASATADEKRKAFLAETVKPQRDPVAYQKAYSEYMDASKKQEQAQLAASAASDRAAAASVGGSVISFSQMSRTDLFDVSRGTVVTRSTPGTVHPKGMFGDKFGAAEQGATFFADGKPAGSEFDIEFATPKPVNLQSIALFAAHDDVGPGRRAFKQFKFFYEEKGLWKLALDFSPAVPYGGDAGPPYGPGRVLAACFELRPIVATYFRASFVQAVNLGTYSAPRVNQLDGYASKNCK